MHIFLPDMPTEGLRRRRMQFGMSSRGTQDGAFSYYGLAKLGASMAHMDPKTKGRAMCEIFGAYGWEESITMMEWLGRRVEGTDLY